MNTKKKTKQKQKNTNVKCKKRNKKKKFEYMIADMLQIPCLNLQDIQEATE